MYMDLLCTAIGLLAVLSKAYDAAADSSPKMRFSSEDEVGTLPDDENVVLDRPTMLDIKLLTNIRLFTMLIRQSLIAA